MRAAVSNLYGDIKSRVTRLKPATHLAILYAYRDCFGLAVLDWLGLAVLDWIWIPVLDWLFKTKKSPRTHSIIHDYY